TSDPPLRGPSRIRRRVHAWQPGHPRGKRPIGLALHNDGVVSHSPASFRILAASPVPTSFFVCTASVMIRPVFGWMSCRWLPLPVLASTNPAALRRRINSPHVTTVSITERLVSLEVSSTLLPAPGGHAAAALRTRLCPARVGWSQ